MIFVKSLIFYRSAHHSSVVRQSAPEDGVRHVEALPEHEEEGGGGVDDEGVGAGQGGPGADLAEGREDQRENPELMFLSEAPALQLGLSGGRACPGEEEDHPGLAVQGLHCLAQPAGDAALGAGGEIVLRSDGQGE